MQCSIEGRVPISPNVANGAENLHMSLLIHYSPTTHYNYLINKEKHKDNIEIKYCKAILKTGKNKGSECKCIIKDKDSIYCKRHTKT